MIPWRLSTGRCNRCLFNIPNSLRVHHRRCWCPCPARVSTTQLSWYTSLRNRRWKSSLQEDRLSPLEFRFKPISRSETIDRDIRRVRDHLRSAAQLQNHRSVPFGTRETIARVIVAFPSIGCGQLGFDPNTIAQHMIAETHQNLKHAIQSSLTVSFVLLPDQQKIYDAFINQLNVCRLANDAPVYMPFEKQGIPTNARLPSIAHYGCRLSL